MQFLRDTLYAVCQVGIHTGCIVFEPQNLCEKREKSGIEQEKRIKG